MSSATQPPAPLHLANRVATIALLALLSLTAHGQVIKCKGANGQTVYSDKPCADGSAGQEVNVNANTLDGSYDRQRVEVSRARSKGEDRRREIDAMMRNPPAHCRSKFFSLNDFAGGDKLAERAKRECIENTLNERDGAPTSDTHTRAYKKHQDWVTSEVEKSGQRDAVKKWRSQNVR